MATDYWPRRKTVNKNYIPAAAPMEIARGPWLEILATVGIPTDSLIGSRGRPCPRCGGRDRFCPLRDFTDWGIPRRQHTKLLEGSQELYVAMINNDLSGERFVYEPQGMEVDGGKPELLRTRLDIGMVCAGQLAHFDQQIIEYKPTLTCANEFETRCKTLVKRFDDLGCYEFSRRSIWVIYYGSVFNEHRGVFICQDDCVEDVDHDWIEDFEPEIKATRFDLEAPS